MTGCLLLIISGFGFIGLMVGNDLGWLWLSASGAALLFLGVIAASIAEHHGL